jgi:hypothetical protein
MLINVPEGLEQRELEIDQLIQEARSNQRHDDSS